MLFYISAIIRFLIYSNFWIAFAASALTIQTYYVFDAAINWAYVALVFFATIAAYTFQRILKDTEPFEKNKRHLWISQHLTYLKTLFPVAAIGVLISVYFLPAVLLYLLIPTAIISVLYAGDFLRYLGIKTPNLRSVPHLKIYLIAASWATLCVFLCGFLIYDQINTGLLLLSTLVFFFILGITIPFDIRDIDIDNPAQKTFPQLLGVRGARIIAVICVMISYGIGNWEFGFSVWTAAATIIILGAISYSNKRLPDLYYTGIMDGLIIVYAGSIILDMVA